MALKDNAWRKVRWTVALGLLAVGVAGLFLGWFEVCSKTVTKDGVESVCKQPTVGDAGVVGSVLLVILLLLPDMSEIGVFGISLKRRVEAAEQKARTSEEKAQRVEDQLALQSIRMDNLAQANATSAAQANVGPILIGDAAIQHAQSVLPEKEQAFLAGEDAPVEEAPVQPVDYAKVGQLIANWEAIGGFIGPPIYWVPNRRSLTRPKRSIPDEDADRFIELFSEQLHIVRAARNAVAHASPISPEDLQSAIDISESLLRILRDRWPGTATPVS